jgi:hypothetical protein
MLLSILIFWSLLLQWHAFESSLNLKYIRLKAICVQSLIVQHKLTAHVDRGSNVDSLVTKQIAPPMRTTHATNKKDYMIDFQPTQKSKRSNQNDLIEAPQRLKASQHVFQHAANEHLKLQYHDSSHLKKCYATGAQDRRKKHSARFIACAIRFL